MKLDRRAIIIYTVYVAVGQFCGAGYWISSGQKCCDGFFFVQVVNSYIVITVVFDCASKPFKNILVTMYGRHSVRINFNTVDMS